ncbi:MAG: diguanylate cyclase [Gammaproteobacteria bacterium]|jgi:diguanylate cyclase (GGDEF)-like protein|nr:diguanylate cyclase [Gammaproteobacteria bacterium]
MSKPAPTNNPDESRLWQPDFVYAALLLAVAIACLTVLSAKTGLLANEYGLGTAGFFIVFALFTITTGFPHPVFGYVSMDRVAQVMSILILGPVDAALVNGIASFIYPWHRLRLGVPFQTVLMAALNNAGLMIFVVLGAGTLYQYLGGAIPVHTLDLGAGLLLLALVVCMQVINDVGMMIFVYLRQGDPLSVFNPFTLVVELLSGAAGIVLAIAFANYTVPEFALILAVLAAGMLVIMKYALMRSRLQNLVDERTEELRVQAEEFERQATHDNLTKLPNRRHADSFLQQQHDRVQDEDHVGVIALADVDHFKRINDNHSHAVGDLVLERVARILRKDCRKTDFVARYGGEEFLLYLPCTNTEQALEVCSQLRLAVQNAGWTDLANGLAVTISFGLAEITGTSLYKDVLNEADTRLYRAKNEGRNRVIAA